MGVAHFHRRGEAVPKDWYTIKPAATGDPVFDDLKFANVCVSELSPDGSRTLRTLRGHFYPLISAGKCANVIVTFKEHLTIERIDRQQSA